MTDDQRNLTAPRLQYDHDEQPLSAAAVAPPKADDRGASDEKTDPNAAIREGAAGSLAGAAAESGSALRLRDLKTTQPVQYMYEDESHQARGTASCRPAGVSEHMRPGTGRALREAEKADKVLEPQYCWRHRSWSDHPAHCGCIRRPACIT